MKVVLFCGGQGMRLRDHSDAIPKPMVDLGYRPVLWHLMKYYAHFGHKEFILCLGYRADYIKRYFLNYEECVSNDFTLRGSDIQLHNSDIHDWKITFVDTGLQASVGERLWKVRSHLQDQQTFLANYADGLSDVCLDSMLKHHRSTASVATCLCVKPTQSFHLIETDDAGLGQRIWPVSKTEQWMNGGFFIMNPKLFEYMRDGEDLACEPFQRLIADKKLGCYRYNGFWGCMDTFKEKQALDDRYRNGDAPWQVWQAKASPDEY